ncbi:MAG: AAA family ATPase, partial [bacterium]|nr:AAA family ATPase [bacterium]
LPYGIADFQALIRDGYVYVDRTAHIHDIEDLGRHILFIRPRRFGKSLWLQTLAAYYDLRTAGAHEELFGHLAVGKDPTPNAHRYFVLKWDFSEVQSRGSVDEIARSLGGYINTEFESFLIDYRDYLPQVTLRDDARHTFIAVLAAIRQTPYPLYLMIDEYDNFANEIMVRDKSVYSELVHGVGPYKELMKSVKSATQGRGLERVFATGVSPIVMSDLSSGMNILTNLCQRRELNALCGFTEGEIKALLEQIRALSDPPVPWTVEETRRTIRDWYNGYRFSPRSEEQVYNPTMTLYFLDHLRRDQESPRELLDDNLAADEDKLRFVARIVSGQQALLDLLQKDEPIEIPKLAGRFTLAEMLERSSYDRTFLASFLAYFGMLTIKAEATGVSLRLGPPNMVVRRLYVDQVLHFLLPSGGDRSAAWDHARAVLLRGEIGPLLTFVEEKLFPVMSNRDYVFMDEHSLKMVFLALLWSECSHLLSEPELNRGYADLCLLRRPDRRVGDTYDLVFEFKYAKLGDLGKTGVELRQMERQELAELSLVEELFAAAEAQLGRYREALEELHGETLRLRTYAVVALGFERLVARELE